MAVSLVLQGVLLALSPQGTHALLVRTHITSVHPAALLARFLAPTAMDQQHALAAKMDTFLCQLLKHALLVPLFAPLAQHTQPVQPVLQAIIFLAVAV